MASKLAQLLTTARALPPTPFRASGPQLTDAIEGMASRAFNMPAKSDVRDVEAKTLSSYEEERVERAIAALGRLRQGEALRERLWPSRRLLDVGVVPATCNGEGGGQDLAANHVGSESHGWLGLPPPTTLPS
ncbi:hypothetical protein A1Q2_04302 [Trichosporon asahii var. asahii CBS 8904]|uniref:Uncharacterized protein n=1 Tax=Trichosporon asahii var. asahii (strain CBS 8904) TaxID=1220162 RepID=K1VBS0_TRIAC|nr:hypothetical protein A1Q2_04302 [Trichosporon asahii var. asahii CBS 8904]